MGIPFSTSYKSLLSATSFSKDLLKFSLNMPCCDILFITMLLHWSKYILCNSKVGRSAVMTEHELWAGWKLLGSAGTLCECWLPRLSPGSDDPWSVPEMTLDWAALSPSLRPLTQRTDPELWKMLLISGGKLSIAGNHEMLMPSSYMIAFFCRF